MYGMGAKLMSQNLKVSVDECREILNEFFKMFPQVKDFVNYNEQSAKIYGFVEDYLGRRRRLKDALLPEIEMRATKTIFTNYTVFPGTTNEDAKLEIPDEETNALWTRRYNENYKGKGYNAKDEFKKLCKEANVAVFDNGAFISKTLTQCTNSRIQGSASSLTKKAMVAIYRNEKLSRCGFRLLVPVHDELLGECPKEYADEVAAELCQTMINAAKPECSVPMKVDAYIVKHWYADEVLNSISLEYKNLIKDGRTQEKALAILHERYEELRPESVDKMALGTFDLLEDGP